jgi:hypothetical protein
MKIKLLFLSVVVLAVGVMTACKKDTFNETTGVCPEAVSTTPFNGATAIPLDQVIQATFNTTLDPATIVASAFKLEAGTVVNGDFSYNAITKTMRFIPDSLLAENTTYRGTISRSIKDVKGNLMQEDYVWTFSTGDVLSPMITCSDPVYDATNVVVTKIIKVCFSMPMEASSFGPSSFALYDGVNYVDGTVRYENQIAFFTPDFQLSNSTIYTATIRAGVMSTSGYPLQFDYSWSFTTTATLAPIVQSTVPANLATGVARNQIISATFSRQMDPLTILPTTFLLSDGTNMLSGQINYSGNTASFTPDSLLLSGTTYTATITTGAMDLSGIPLDVPYEWEFTTVNPLGPGVVDLGSVARFGIIAGVGVSNQAGFSVINNLDVGIYPGVRSSVVGFPPAIINNGAIYCADDLIPVGTNAMLQQAKLDLVAAYNFAAAASTPAPQTVSGDLGGTTLAPGIYTTASSLLIQSGDLTLDAQGDQNAVWIFQIGSAFTTVGGAGGNVILSGGAQAKNIFWQTGSSATIGDFTIFYGNVLALESITMNTGAVATGRMLARNSAVVMTSGNTINKP